MTGPLSRRQQEQLLHWAMRYRDYLNVAIHTETPPARALDELPAVSRCIKECNEALYPCEPEPRGLRDSQGRVR